MRYMVLTYVTARRNQVNERMTLHRNLRNNMLQTANVILDFKTKSVIKANMADKTVPKDWDRILSFYHRYYGKDIDHLMALHHS